MTFIRRMTRSAGEGFKELADQVWDEVGDVSEVAEQYREMGRTAGKYALTAQLLMTLNFPDEAETFRTSFNVTGIGPTGAEGFEGSPVARLLNGVADAATELNAQAIGTTGVADVSQTSTFDDLATLLPRIRTLGENNAGN